MVPRTAPLAPFTPAPSARAASSASTASPAAKAGRHARRRAILILTVAALLVGACGSSPSASAGRTAGASATPGNLAATKAPGASTAPGDSSAPSNPGLGAASDDGTSGANSAICALVTKDEIAAAAGDTVSNIEGDEQSCTWTLAQLNAVNLRIESTDASDFAAQKILFPDGRDVQGVGERAFWGPSLGVLYSVYKGKTYAVQLVLFSSDDAKNLTLATAILQKALSRL